MHRAATADLPGSCVELETGAANEHVAMDVMTTRRVPCATSSAGRRIPAGAANR